MRVEPVHCAPFANDSERRAVEHLKHRLISTPGEGEWILLSNLWFSASHRKQAVEIDIVAIGPPGVRVIEVKHWETTWIDEHEVVVEREAEKVTAKAAKIGTTLRKRIRSIGYVDGVILVTQEASKVEGLTDRHVKGVPMYTLDYWREALNADARGVLSEPQVRKLAKALAPNRGDVGGSLTRFGGFVDLVLRTPAEERFHRRYTATDARSRERVVLHVYDLSAGDDRAETKARREFDALRRVRHHKWAPEIQASYQDAPGYDGEMKFFAIDAPEAPSLAKRISDASWGTEERLVFALQALRALDELHGEISGGEHLVHRNLSPETVLVRHDNLPILTGFDRAKIPELATVSTIGPSSESDEPFVAPEVRNLGLDRADHRSDIYQMCATLAELFSGQTDKLSRDALQLLSDGTAEAPRNRADLGTLIRRFRELGGERVSRPAAPPAEFWTAEQIVQFGNYDYKIEEKLGHGGIGIAYKVAKLDPRSGEPLGHYVAKVVVNAPIGRVVLNSYHQAHADLRHPALSTIFEVAPEWQEDSILALLTWISGEPLTDYLGDLYLIAAERSEEHPENCLLDWLRQLCEALDVLHGRDLVHGDVSPGNLLLSDSKIVLTDYDLVTRIGFVASSPGSSSYCSPSREERRPVQPSDDFYALGASFFHALFGRRPFQYGGNQLKERGLNWDGIDFTEHPTVRHFLDRATAPTAAQRYLSASDALSDLVARGELAAQHGRGKEDTVRHDVRSDRTRSVKWYRDAAEQGDMDAQHVLGEFYRHGNGVEQDFAEAAKWYRRAADQGHAEAQCNLGNLYCRVNGIGQNYAKAARWYRRAADQGHAEAQSALGFLYCCGDGVSNNYRKAAYWYRKAAGQGYQDAQFSLGDLYYFGRGVSNDYAKAARWYQRAAEQGLGEAQYSLGHLYAIGYGVEQDEAKAAEWYSKAAAQGHQEAQYSLGNLYLFGKGVAQDEAEAAHWYRKAAEQGDAEAQYELGRFYEYGKGVGVDYTEAAEWYKKAAERGRIEAQYELGRLYHRGNGVVLDYAEAARWYRKAAEGGHADSQFLLGEFYEGGFGVAQDEAGADEWYRKAAVRYLEDAKQGKAKEQYRLGYLYLGGHGVPRDSLEAAKWYRKAAEQGYAEAQYGLGWLFHQGTEVPQDLSEAEDWYRRAAQQGNVEALNALSLLQGHGD